MIDNSQDESNLARLANEVITGASPAVAEPEAYGIYEQEARTFLKCRGKPEAARRVKHRLLQDEAYHFLEARRWQAFPSHLLPEPIRAYVCAAAASIPCDEALIAVPAMASLSAAVGASARLEVKEHSWYEPATLWTVLVAPSGSAKSPALEKALAPIYTLEAEARDRHEHALERYEQEVAAGNEEARRPVRRRYRTGNATTEAITRILQDNPHGVLLARDELAGWLGSFDRYANGDADAQFWIELHGGNQVSNDRIGSGNVTIDRPAVAVTGTIQPGVLRDKIAQVHFESGFAARLLLAMPPAKPKVWTEASVTPEVWSAYESLLSALYPTSPGTCETVRIDTAARERLKAFVNAHGEKVFSMPEGPERAVVSKTETHSLRIALLLHLARRACGKACEQVDESTLAAGIAIGEWLQEETLRVYEELELAGEALPPRLQLLQLLPEQFETAEAEQAAEHAGVSRATLFRWLDRLQSEGHVRKHKRGMYENVYPVRLETNETNHSTSYM